MIIHYKEDLSQYSIVLSGPLKYSESFTFVPIKFHKDNDYHKCILQTPLLFSPFGIQTLPNGKRVIDISFQNKNNDNSQSSFLYNLNRIYKIINRKYKSKYKVNPFIKNTDFNECIRLKLLESTSLYDESRNNIQTINRFTYGSFIIHLEGLWINKNDIWFQWTLLQACAKIPIHLKEYSFIDEIHEVKNKEKKISDKYDKMLKMGVPKEAVIRQQIMDGKIPPPPPPPGESAQVVIKSRDIPKIKASDLMNVKLKKGKSRPKKIIEKDPNHFEPPTLEELQTTLSRLRPTK